MFTTTLRRNMCDSTFKHTQSGAELEFVTTRKNSLALNEQDINKAVVHLGGRPMRVKISIGDPGVAEAAPAAPKEQEDEVGRRALEHPEVRRFIELFPGGEVRQVRNLKE